MTSVIIPSYNAARYVVQAVESALAQTLRPSEIIVVDDGSHDGTEAVLRPYASHGVLYVRQENAGVSAARNNGLGRATGDYIAFLDADDVWHRRKLEIQVRAFDAHPRLAMIGTGRFGWPGAVPDIEPVGGAPSVKVVPWRALVVRNAFTTSSVMVRRSALRELGEPVFDGALQGPEDYDLWLRLATRAPVGNLLLPLTGYRESFTGLGNQPSNMARGGRRILAKLDATDAWSRAGGPGARSRAYAYYYFSCAVMHNMAGNMRAALSSGVQSLVRYPFPFGPAEQTLPFARLKLLAVALLRLLRLKRFAIPDK